MSDSVLHPTIAWAQRSDNILITVAVQDAADVKLSVQDNVFELSCTGGEKKYFCKFPLFADVVPEESTTVTRPRQIEIKLKKKDENAEYWPRLQKEKVKSQHIQIDWNRWKDEDEEAAADDGDFGMGGGALGGMGGAGGMPGMGGMGGMDMQALMAQMGGMGGLGGMGGMPGMGGMGMGGDDEGMDSDDEEGAEEAHPEDEMPPLEDNQ